MTVTTDQNPPELDPPGRTDNDDVAAPSAPQPTAPAASGRGLWECLNLPNLCSLAAPDPRTQARYFEGPTQAIARAAGLDGTVVCPECGFKTVIYRGDVAA